MPVIAALVLFLLPAAVYLVWRRYGRDGGEPSSPVLIALLLAAGVILAGGAWYGLSRSLDRDETYVPARLGPDGRVISNGGTR